MTSTATSERLEPSVAGAAAPPGAFRRNYNLTRELAVTQFKLKYSGSVLGYLWSLLKPLMLFGIMYVIFAGVLHVGNASPNFALQLLVAIVLWTYFAETTSIGLSSMVANAHLLKKAYFPRPILVIASTLTALMTFGINLSLIVIIAAPLHGLDLGLHTLAVVPLFVELYLLTLGTALVLAALFVFFRDIAHIWEIFSQLLFYGSAVVYPLSISSGKQWLIVLNPVAQVIEDVRHALVTTKVPWSITAITQPLPALHQAGRPALLFAIPPVIVVAVVVIGWVVFARTSPDFAEHL